MGQGRLHSGFCSLLGVDAPLVWEEQKTWGQKQVLGRAEALAQPLWDGGSFVLAVW